MIQVCWSIFRRANTGQLGLMLCLYFLLSCSLTFNNGSSSFYEYVVELVSLLSLFLLFNYYIVAPTMPSIVSQTQFDSPTFSSPLLDYDENEVKVSNVSLTVAEDLSCVQESLVVVDNASNSPSHSFLKSCAKTDASKLYAAAPPDWVLSKPSDWTVSSVKKRRKTAGKRRATSDVADDPASLRLAHKIRHDDLMELHDHFKKNRKDSTTGGGVSKNKIATHGLAPRGMSIPEKGKAYVIGGGIVVTEPLMESTLERHNRFKEEEERAKKKKEKKEVNQLKKDGKVTTLAPYMFS